MAENEKKMSRGFIVTTADNQEDAKKIREGQHVKMDISPVLAGNEELAIKVVQESGKIVISITPLELLELEIKLLHDLAQDQNIELVREQIFNVQEK